MWTCRKCRSRWHQNKLRCDCGRARPTRPRSHKAILKEMPYEDWVARFGEVCGICGVSPKPGKKLMRDHWHVGPLAGQARGLLCWKCNKYLHSWMDNGWPRKAADYLDAAAG